jgi:predicted flavoprotein YhiN
VRDVVVIGAGAAGIMAAYRAAELGARVVLLEKTERIGTKILISGGGKCNITHAGPIEEVLKEFRPNEARFIRPACYRWTNEQAVSFLTDKGLRVYTRENGRVFPVDQTAKDVVHILQSRLDEVGVETRLNTPVIGIERDEDGVCGVRIAPPPTPSPRHDAFAERGLRNSPLHEDVRASRGGVGGGVFIETSRVVLAVGGSSYPKSGTTGDGYPWATSFGHTIVKVRAALAPIALTETKWRQYSGVALRDCTLKARQKGKEVNRWRDDLLFTHFGVSGPTALGISREVAEAFENGPVTLEVDVLPDRTFESLTDDLLAYAEKHPKRRVATYLDALLPSRLVEEVLRDAEVATETEFNKLTRAGRNKLVECLKGWRLGLVSDTMLTKGEVVAGGIALDEVDAQTMRSLKCPGLYLCGEALDIAGPVGGYNLQAAFSTGYVAGETAAGDLLG